VNARNNGRLDSCVTGAVAISRRNLIATAGVAVILLLVLFSLPIAVEPRIKQRLVNALGERFDSEVQLETLTVSLLPSRGSRDEGWCFATSTVRTGRRS
jgi:hypothetical protein